MLYNIKFYINPDLRFNNRPGIFAKMMQNMFIFQNVLYNIFFVTFMLTF